MRAATIHGRPPAARPPARVLPDLASCTADQLVRLAYDAAMTPAWYADLVGSPGHVQAILGLVLRFDAMLDAVLATRSSQEELITTMARSLRDARELVRALNLQAERRAATCWCANTERDAKIPPAMEQFEEINDVADDDR